MFSGDLTFDGDWLEEIRVVGETATLDMVLGRHRERRCIYKGSYILPTKGKRFCDDRYPALNQSQPVRRTIAIEKIKHETQS